MNLVPVYLFLPTLPVAALPYSVLPAYPVMTLRSVRAGLVSPSNGLGGTFFPSLTVG